ncbi:MAG: hypothetical protein ABIO83_00990 [Ilumatobacteraceae bacterium]
MPTPIPSPDDTDLEPPSRDEVELIARGCASATSSGDGLTELQIAVLGAVTTSMTGFSVDIGDLEPITATDYAEGLARRNLAFRTRLVQIMELGHMILPDASIDVADRIIDFARELEVDDDDIHRAREVAAGSRQLIAADFDRNRYLADLDLSAFTPLRTADDKSYAWTTTADRPALAQRWRDLGDLGTHTLGRNVHDFYVARGFRFPGEPGSAPPLLAQHDWVHVIADYGSVVDSELEVFAFIARASDNPEAFTLLAMVINLFQTGQLQGAAGIFQADPGHLSRDGMPARLADALRRGARCHGSVDFLATDFWSMADMPLDHVRAHFGVEPKSAAAVAAGSPGPRSAGGISEYQLRAGQELALEQQRPYDSFGATL